MGCVHSSHPSVSQKEYTHDFAIVRIRNSINQSPDDDGKQLQLPQGTWQEKLNKINDKIAEFKLDENIEWTMMVNDTIIDPFDVLQFQKVLSITAPSEIYTMLEHQTNGRTDHELEMQIIQVFEKGQFCKWNGSNVQIYDYQYPNLYYIYRLSNPEYQKPVPSHELKSMHDSDLQKAKIQYDQIISNIALLDHALKQYCIEEHIDHIFTAFIAWSESKYKNFGSVRYGDRLVAFARAPSISALQPDQKLRETMMTDLVQYIYKEKDNGVTEYKSTDAHTNNTDNTYENQSSEYYNPMGECYNPTKEYNNPIGQCSAVKRVLSALEMYSQMDIYSMEQQGEFIKYMNDEYQGFLDDYIHLMSAHSRHLEMINSSLKPCDISQCSHTARRHFKDDILDGKGQDGSEDVSFRFYSSIMDSLHFYLYHLFDVGLRVRSDLPRNEDVQSPGSEFRRICAAVKAGREVAKCFDVSQSNAKFNFSISQAGIKDKIYPITIDPNLHHHNK